ncbi:hypothetical protein BC826DRAFT_1049519 [Russula brevipes]|nr:hypothetical protein BC826DRAFT_1049519 [Russula brevipes]
MQIVVVRFSGRTTSLWSAQYNSENMKGARVGCERKRKRKTVLDIDCFTVASFFKYMHSYID